MQVDWSALLGLLISLFSAGNVVVYFICILRSRNWRRVLWAAFAIGSAGLCASYIALVTGYITPERIAFLIRPAILVIVVGLFAFGLWELTKGARNK